MPPRWTRRHPSRSRSSPSPAVPWGDHTAVHPARESFPVPAVHENPSGGPGAGNEAPGGRRRQGVGREAPSAGQVRRGCRGLAPCHHCASGSSHRRRQSGRRAIVLTAHLRIAPTCTHRVQAGAAMRALGSVTGLVGEAGRTRRCAGGGPRSPVAARPRGGGHAPCTPAPAAVLMPKLAKVCGPTHNLR